MLKQALIRPPKLRTAGTEEKERHATWLELFYDLVIVVAVSQVAHVLSLDHSPKGVVVAIGLFMPVGWVWAGHTVYAARFDTDDLVYRLFTFFQMFAVMGMAVEVAHAAHGEGRGFGISYLWARIILLILLTRAFYHVPGARFFNRVYLIGFGIGAGIWALSLLLPQDRQWILWILSLMVELPVPWYIWFKKHALSDITASHIPERLGLFTIIVLGESVVAPARGLTEQRWKTEAVATAAFGFLVAICVWWIYFRHLERAIGRFRLGSGQTYIYSHIPFWIGIIMMSVGTLHAIMESHASLSIIRYGYAPFGGVCPMGGRRFHDGLCHMSRRSALGAVPICGHDGYGLFSGMGGQISVAGTDGWFSVRLFPSARIYSREKTFE